MTSGVGQLDQLNPEELRPNPKNPRRYFNEERLDLLRTSIQEVGILVPLIAYRDPESGSYVLMDGERRWRSALDLGLDRVPANVIPAPTPLDNLLRMFNIHNVREDWPLISVALSMAEVIELSGETGEVRLSEMTGLTRSTVRRAKRLLSIPAPELDMIQAEAHLDRTRQVHREDLYLEIEAAESVLRSQVPEIAEQFDRPTIIRKFAEKAEEGSLRAVTDFRFVPKLVKAVDNEAVSREEMVRAVGRLIEDSGLSPKDVFDDVAAVAFRQQTVQRKIELLNTELQELLELAPPTESLLDELGRLRGIIDRYLGGAE